VKIYVATAEALREKKERGVQNRMKLSLPKKIIWCISVFHPRLNANVFICRFFFLNLTQFWTKLRVLVLCFPYFKGIRYCKDLVMGFIRIRNRALGLS